MAMKQFPKLQGKQVDSSAYVEFHAHEIIKKNSDLNGKPLLPPTLKMCIEQENLCMLIDSVVEKRDFWLIYELC